VSSQESSSDDRDTPTLGEVRRALADPTRFRVLEALWDGRKTAKELAVVLGVVPNRLYYHLRILEEAGIIRVVDAAVTGRFAERVYGASVAGYGAELVGPSTDPEDRAAFFGAMLAAAGSEIRDVVFTSGSGPAGGRALDLHVVRAVLHTTPEEFAALTQEIDRLSARATRRGDPHARAYRLVVAAYEVVPALTDAGPETTS